MTRRSVVWLAAGWALATAALCVAIERGSAISPSPEPNAATIEWAFDALHAARLGEPVPEPPPGPRATGVPVVIHAWVDGLIVGRHTAESTLEEAVPQAAEALFSDPTVLRYDETRRPRSDPTSLELTISFGRGQGPLLLGLPFVENLSLVPMREGLRLEVEREPALTTYLTPVELHESGAYDRGVQTPIPDLRFGLPVRALLGRMARNLGLSEAEAMRTGSAHRVLFETYSERPYPEERPVTAESLRDAAVEGADFLLRHQQDNGRYVYVYDAAADDEKPETYNLPRHAGTTFFLGQVGRIASHERAREGARRGLAFLQSGRTRRCGGPDRHCVAVASYADLGSSALAALAAAEYLAGGDDPQVRAQLVGLTTFLRSMQREDGELMHDFDLEAQEAIDVQHLYYSGEAAYALLRAYAVLGDERDLEAARGVMAHLTGAGWSFLGSRYYYGEEHWTCIAAGEAVRQGLEVGDALDFCQRWAGFNRAVQFRRGDTPWAAAGAYGVGPLILPRLTPVASRSEAFVSTYEMTIAAGLAAPALERQIERGLGMLLRYRWAPGPTYLLADPRAAEGGLPGSPAELIVRNDYVQHAGSAMLRWSELLEERRRDTDETPP